MIQDPKIKERFAQARFLLARKWPFMAPVLYRLIPVEDRNERVVAWVDDRGHLGLGQDFAKLTPQEAEGVLAHELFHVLRDHVRLYGHNTVSHPVLKTLPPKLARDLVNLTWDIEIDDDLKDMGFALPPLETPWGNLPDHCQPEHFGLPRGRTWAEYLELLLQKLQGDGGFQDDLDQVLDLIRDVMAGGEGEEGQDQFGQGLSETELDVLRRAVAEQALAQEARKPGSVPGTILRWAQALAQPKVDWRKRLAHLIRSGLAKASLDRQDYSFRRLSRRTLSALAQGPRSTLHPALQAPAPEVLVVVDTSGSVQGTELEQALSELQGLLQAAQVPVTVAAGDVDLAWIGQVSRVDQVQLVGGGGTDMGRVLDQVLAKTKKVFDLVVVLTDGWTPWPKEKPCRAPIIVVSWDLEGPSWAETVLLKDKERP